MTTLDDLAASARRAAARDLELAYRQTGNPLYVWSALRGWPVGEAFPGWIHEYLQRSAAGLQALTFPSRRAGDPDLPAEVAITRIPEALGLTGGRAQNAIRSRRQDNADSKLMAALDVAEIQGQSRATALEQIAAETSSTPDDIRERIGRAAKLWQRSAQELSAGA